MSESGALRFLDLKKTYYSDFYRYKFLALKGVTFEVPEGKIFGFLGANGAGKTTAIKIALDIQEASGGTVEIFGQPRKSAATKQRIGFMPERPYFHLNLTASEFLDFHRSLYGPAQAGKARPSNRELLGLVGLPDTGRRQLRAFSKGMLQRIGLAQALVNDPDLLILDEPMSGLDPVGRREVRNLIVDLNARGKTIFFSTHILSDVESICSQLAFLEKGQLSYCGSVAKLLESHAADYELIFRKGAMSEIAGALGAQSFGDAFRITIPTEGEARRVLETLVRQGAEMVSFNRMHKSLEEVLFGKKG